ncbi:hypothetical protein UY3_06129 [Chelonia mydas]|uniref:Myb/SANT-like DNA-binding domain-containing protein n=1 Tax=Chelonia mydas TaxID=8469 RepID=M7BXD1_CHEMY|nr:hypothetical protein UY3_06129 [Chelonia mydas]
MVSSVAQVTMQSPPNRKRVPVWTKRETLDLIAVWGEESVQAKLRSKRRNANIYAKIVQGMVERGYNKDTQQYHMKVKELRQAFQKTKAANSHSGSEPQPCHFYDQLHDILGGDPTTTPPLSVDACKGESHATGRRILWRRRMRSRQAMNPFSPAASTFSSPWSQYPPKVGSPTLKRRRHLW